MLCRYLSFLRSVAFLRLDKVSKWTRNYEYWRFEYCIMNCSAFGEVAVHLQKVLKVMYTSCLSRHEPV
jgi:hypothetical protein